MIAVALGLISLVVMIATGVAASSTADDHLTFLGVGVQTTTAQVFLTGAIFGWLLVIALWLLRVGMHRSGDRSAQLAARRARRASQWLGFSEADAEEDGWGDWDEWGGLGGRAGSDVRGAEVGGVRFQTAAMLDPDDRISPDGTGHGGFSGRSGSTEGIEGIVSGTGTTRHGSSTPWRPDGRPDNAYRPVAGTADQPRPLPGDHPAGPVAGRLLPGVADSRPGLGVDGGTQGRQIGGGSGSVPGEDRGPEGEHGSGEGRQ